MKQSLFPLYTISALLILAGCSKEKAGSPSQVASSSIMDFDPHVDQIRGLIRDFQHLKELYRSRDGDDLGERPLNEAVWMSEADANYTLCDASAEGMDRTDGTIEFTLPLHQKEDGSLWVNNNDLLGNQEVLLTDLREATGGQQVYLVDVQMTSANGEEARMQASWVILSGTDDRAHIPIDMPTPTYTGCWPAMGPDPSLDDGADVMRIKLKKIYPVGTYFTSVSKVDGVTDITVYGLGPAPTYYTVYYGTKATLFPGIGPGWIHTGQNASNEICFPDYWNKFVLLRDRYADPSSFTGGREIIINDFRANYSPLSGGPMNYGSPYYPMGPYHHSWTYQTGIPMTGH